MLFLGIYLRKDAEMKSSKFGYARLLMSAAMIFALPLSAYAYPLTITNLTKSTVSVKVNGQCSAEFGNIASMISHTAETKSLEALCGAMSGNCMGQIYVGASCASTEIANFYFNTKTRTNGGGAAASHYKISVDAHRVTVSQQFI
jgi:hypothetical protein